MTRKTHEQFIAELADRQPDIEVLDTYVDSRTKVSARCKVCGHSWESYPGGLLRGKGCSNCHIAKQRIPFPIIEARIAKACPSVKIVGDYVNQSTKVLTHCNLCGHEWPAWPTALQRGCGCPKCKGKKITQRLLKTHDQFVVELREVNPNIEVLGRYSSSQEKIAVRCTVCNYEWSTRAQNLLRGKPRCKCSKTYRRTHEEYVAEVAEINPSIEVLGTFTATEEKIKVRCKVCGRVWEPVASSPLQGKGCSRCSRCEKPSTEEFAARVAEENPSIEILGWYVNNHTAILCRCRACGHEWSPVPAVLTGKQKQGCPACGRKRQAAFHRKPREVFVAQVAEVNPSVEVVGEYVNGKTGILCRCRACGYEWSPIPDSLLRGSGCPKCDNHSTSLPEQFLFLLISRYYPKTVNRDVQAIGMELDILVPERATAIEYGSWFYHRSRHAKDIEKQRLCSEHGIELFVVYDDYHKETPPDGFEHIITTTKSCWLDAESLLSLFKPILCTLEIPESVFTEDLSNLFAEAYKLSKSPTISLEQWAIEMEADEILQAWHPEKNHEITPEDVSYGSKKKVWWRHWHEDTQSWHEWQTTASSMTRHYREGRKSSSIGCPYCGGRTVLPGFNDLATVRSDIAAEWHPTKNGNMRPESFTKGSNKKVWWVCSECGNEWQSVIHVRAKSSGPGCAKCKRKTIADNLRMTESEFLQRLSSLTDTIEVEGEYIGYQAKVACRCLICGHEWAPRVSDLLQGKGCPPCGHKKAWQNRTNKVHEDQLRLF